MECLQKESAKVGSFFGFIEEKENVGKCVKSKFCTTTKSVKNHKDVYKRQMQQIAKKDILLSYPYESMEPFLRLLKEASEDPNVMLIKITIYRLAKQARLVEYLCQAAENGKEVTVLIELRARFDEQNNIEWSKRLEEAGCRVIYGSEGYKVHSKICLVAYRNRNEIRYITQVGTGNYNEKTAKMYTDVCLMTADQSIGKEAVEFFKNMAIGNLEGEYHRLLVSPVSLKKTVLSMIDKEIQKGREGRIVMKMNSVTDLDFIRKIAEMCIRDRKNCTLMQIFRECCSKNTADSTNEREKRN